MQYDFNPSAFRINFFFLFLKISLDDYNHRHLSKRSIQKCVKSFQVQVTWLLIEFSHRLITVKKYIVIACFSNQACQNIEIRRDLFVWLLIGTRAILDYHLVDSGNLTNKLT